MYFEHALQQKNRLSYRAHSSAFEISKSDRPHAMSTQQQAGENSVEKYSPLNEFHIGYLKEHLKR